MTIRYAALPTETAALYRSGEPDANGQRPERTTALGPGNPCRHCLGFVAEGEAMLVLAHRPFPAPQPYAEVGPIFLHAANCPRHEGPGQPAIMAATPDYLIKGYGADHRIVYGTGRVVPTAEIEAAAAAIFADPRVAYVHDRSARNNCYQFRIDRA